VNKAVKNYLFLSAFLACTALVTPAFAMSSSSDVPNYEEQQREKEMARVKSSFEENFRPTELNELQNIHKYATDPGIFDDFSSATLDLDIRRDAQREAALSYGARGGLSKRNFMIAQRMEAYEGGLDKIYDFRSLLIKTHSGLMVEPPIISESIANVNVNGGGAEAAVSDKLLQISKDAQIVTAPRNWRHYLVQPYGDVAPPPKILWPENAEEQARWDNWVREGWDQGWAQADEIFETNLNRLVSDFQGMIRYRKLLAQNMVSAPFVMQEDRGVTGGGDEMRIGDRALRITGPSQLQVGSDQWKPADR
jgi:defect-in-organelle-trafficking protein DotC